MRLYSVFNVANYSGSIECVSILSTIMSVKLIDRISAIAGAKHDQNCSPSPTPDTMWNRCISAYSVYGMCLTKSFTTMRDCASLDATVGISAPPCFTAIRFPASKPMPAFTSSSLKVVAKSYAWNSGAVAGCGVVCKILFYA
jgi:hypothetical protein